MSARLILKRALQAGALVVVLPSAILSGFGRVGILYQLFAHAWAGGPGFIGSYLRAAFYRLVLAKSSQDVTIGLGSYFVNRNSTLGAFTSIGAYCVIGDARIGKRCQISSLVNIPGGAHEHVRDAQGRWVDAPAKQLAVIGDDCWIGASAIIMADVGNGSVVGAGAVVTKPVPSNVVVVGNPAQILRSLEQSPDAGAAAGEPA